MAIDPEEVRRHYASLTDDALLGIDSNDLTPRALKVFEAAFDDEVFRSMKRKTKT